MNVNFGLFPPPDVEGETAGGRRPGKAERRQAIVTRARRHLATWMAAETARMIPAD
jgi:hypothetical protein